MAENPFSAGNRYSACQEIPCLNIKPTRFITTFTKACHWILSCDEFNLILKPYFFNTRHPIQDRDPSW